MNLIVVFHLEPIVANGAIYLIASYDFCKQTIMLCNKPTIAMSSVCSSESS